MELKPQKQTSKCTNYVLQFSRLFGSSGFLGIPCKFKYFFPISIKNATGIRIGIPPYL